jgi:AcrR family transcriptional regulator
MPRTTSATPPESDSPERNSSTLQERKQQLVRSAIWDAAIDLFAEKGYNETTVDDIAERAGVSRRSFFRYFSSKGDLVASGLPAYGVYLTTAIDGCPPGYSASRVFRHTVSQVAQQCAAQPRTRKMVQILAKYPAASEAQHSRSVELRKNLAAAFARRKRSLIDFDPAILANLTLAVLNVVFQTWFEREERDVSTTVDQVLATLGHLI